MTIDLVTEGFVKIGSMSCLDTKPLGEMGGKPLLTRATLLSLPIFGNHFETIIDHGRMRMPKPEFKMMRWAGVRLPLTEIARGSDDEIGQVLKELKWKQRGNKLC